MLQYLLYIGQLLGLTLGVMVACGLVAWFSRRVVMYFVCNSARAVFYASSVVGTPVHELGHAIMCVIFAHRITDIKLLTFPGDVPVRSDTFNIPTGVKTDGPLLEICSSASAPSSAAWALWSWC